MPGPAAATERLNMSNSSRARSRRLMLWWWYIVLSLILFLFPPDFPLSFRFSRLLIYIYLFCCLKKIKKSFRLATGFFSLSGHPPLGQRLRGKDISACFLRVLFRYIGSPPSCFSLSISLTQKLHFRISYIHNREKKSKSPPACLIFFRDISKRASHHRRRRPSPAARVLYYYDIRLQSCCDVFYCCWRGGSK